MQRKVMEWAGRGTGCGQVGFGGHQGKFPKRSTGEAKASNQPVSGEEGIFLAFSEQ